MPSSEAPLPGPDATRDEIEEMIAKFEARRRQAEQRQRNSWLTVEDLIEDAARDF